MVLMENFEKRLEPIINTNEELANWFERNQSRMAYYGLTCSDCLHLEENSMINIDNKILGRMANAVFRVLENNEDLSITDRARKAVDVLSLVYDQNKDYFSSEELKETFKIKFQSKQRILF